MSKLKNIIAELCKKKRISMGTLSIKIGKPRTYLYTINTDRDITYLQIKKICKVLKINFADSKKLYENAVFCIPREKKKPFVVDDNFVSMAIELADSKRTDDIVASALRLAGLKVKTK
jgi:hypothetical protein